MSYPLSEEEEDCAEERVNALESRLQKIIALKEMNERNLARAERELAAYRETQADIDAVQEIMQTTAAVVQN